jgi:hypothetical protein
MALEKVNFVPYKDQAERDLDISKVISVRLNIDERERLNSSKTVLQQSKDSTALKLLADIGYHVLHDQLTGQLIATILKNEERNKRSGVGEVE